VVVVVIFIFVVFEVFLLLFVQQPLPPHQ